MTVRFSFTKYFAKYEIAATLAYTTISAYDDFGEPVTAGPLNIEFRMDIQPVSGEDLKQLPEGTQIDNILKFYSKTVLPIDGFDTGTEGSTLLNYNGQDYRLVNRKRYENMDRIKYLAIEERYSPGVP